VPQHPASSFADDLAAVRRAGETDPVTSSAGLLTPGNIDLHHRPRVTNPDGSISTVRSIGFEVDGREVLIPTVSDSGRILSDDEAVQTFRKRASISASSIRPSIRPRTRNGCMRGVN
jgi:hypothetical protein